MKTSAWMAKTGFSNLTMRLWLVPVMLVVLGTGIAGAWGPPVSTITFNTAGGSAIAPITAVEGDPVTAPANPTRAGYNFIGWIPAVPETMPIDDVTCVAQWIEAGDPTSTITFNSAGGTAVAPITQAEGTAVAAPANPTRAGYSFDGWIPAVPATMPVDDVTCVAQWVSGSTITFNSAGGTAVAPITQAEGTAVAAPANPTRAGYVFNGWLPVVPATMPVDDVTCVAQWTYNRSTITFNSAGGTAVAPITQDKGTPVKAPANPTRAEYVFNGWVPAVPATMPVNNLTCVAQWKTIVDADAFEPDDTDETATLIQNNWRSRHTLHHTRDQDRVRFNLTGAGGVDVLLETIGPAGGDTTLWLYDLDDGNLITVNYDGGTGGYSRIALPRLGPGRYVAMVQAVGLKTLAWYELKVKWKESTVSEDDYEQNDISPHAKAIKNNETQNHTIDRVGDYDWVKFTVGRHGAKNLTVETAGEKGNDTEMWLYQENKNGCAGKRLTYDDNDGRWRYSKIFVRYLEPGDYWIKVQEHGNNGLISAYTLKISWLKP